MIKIIGLQGNSCILWINIVCGLQHLGTILESIVPPNSKLEKKNITIQIVLLPTKLNRKLILRLIKIVFDKGNWLWKFNFWQFEVPSPMKVYKTQPFHWRAFILHINEINIILVPWVANSITHLTLNVGIIAFHNAI